MDTVCNGSIYLIYILKQKTFKYSLQEVLIGHAK